jgi:GUCT (NUC152) domain
MARMQAVVPLGRLTHGGLCFRDVKMDLELIGPPTPKQIIEAAADNIKRTLSGTSTDVAKYFESTAEGLLENGVGVLAVVMAQMSGYTELPREKSILGQQEGFVTLGIKTPKGLGFPNPGALIGSIRRITNEKVANQIGKVEIFEDDDDIDFEAAFDVPKVHVEKIVAASSDNGALLRWLACSGREPLCIRLHGTPAFA